MAAASVVWSRAAVAAGQGPPAEPSAAAAARSEAEEAFARGERARRAGRWAEAEASYRDAWKADPRPEFAGELGLCELALGRFRDAAEHLRESLLDPEALAAAARRRFSDGLQRAEREVSPATIAVSRPEAEVFIDGRRIGRGQGMYFVYVEPGRHEAAAQAKAIRRRGGPAACAYAEHAEACSVLADKNRERDTLEVAAWASFIGAGIAGAVAISSFWWAPAPGKRAVRPVPLATAQGGGVVVVGVW
ncbi:hypothetical protein WMF30_36550 [Sorangium sp. So ce134]